MDVTTIVSSEDEEGEKEDIDHPGGSDAVVDDTFWDHDEDVSAFSPTLEAEPPREPALEVTTPTLGDTTSSRPYSTRQVGSPIKPPYPNEEVPVREEEVLI
ncbi:uncharacterized protein A4U43_C10F12610 [Asparagus officinalis]|uniref:Uncharacterized protein n=1 Tax=Asparagus officinalis TaxID=4686 RepID=A0A5P1E2A9_ASPOF|nr:uncharacterized protein A4U43_C10F12610 [Asparagus officinalis]